MNHHLHASLIIVVFSLIFCSCGSYMAQLTSLSPEDAENTIYYWSSHLHDESVMLMEKKAGDISSKPGNGKGEKREYYRGRNFYWIFPSMSPTGRFSIGGPANESEWLTLNNSRVERTQYPVWLYDGAQLTERYAGTVSLPCFAQYANPYTIQWSLLGNNYYVSVSDTIKKCTPEGKQSVMAYIQGVTYFQVSPSERYIVFVRGNSIAVYDLDTKTLVREKEFEGSLDLSTARCVRAGSWSPDESKVAIAEGYRITIFDMGERQNITHFAKENVYDVRWITNDELVYVLGYIAMETSPLKNDPYFAIYRYSVEKQKANVIYKNLNHEPITIKPQVSPSGEILLFSEKGVKGLYEVKLLSLDGARTKILGNGFAPIWGR